MISGLLSYNMFCQTAPLQERDERQMFSMSELQQLDLPSPGVGLRARPLSLEDYDRGYLTLLAQLTTVGDISREEWEARCVQYTHLSIIKISAEENGGHLVSQKTIKSCKSKEN